MFNESSKPATVRRGLLAKKTPPEILADIEIVCSVGAQCPEVQASPMAQHALGTLQQALTAARGSVTNRQLLGQSLTVAIKTMNSDLDVVKDAFSAYQSAVVVIAKRDATVINKAGLEARDQKPTVVAFEGVTAVSSKPGKRSRQGIASWPAAAGATGYALEVNYTPENPSGPWTALTPGGARRRVVTAPTPGGQLLLRVAALGSGDQQSDWSDPILVTTL